MSDDLVTLAEKRTRYAAHERFALSAPETLYLNGYSRDEHGHTRWRYRHDQKSIAGPHKASIAGHGANERWLRDACHRVAKAARLTSKTVLDWWFVAEWLDAGIGIGTICDAISQQVASMGDRYQGCYTLKLFERAVLNAGERAKE
jgi:hypothetical protein